MPEGFNRSPPRNPKTLRGADEVSSLNDQFKESLELLQGLTRVFGQHFGVSLPGPGVDLEFNSLSVNKVKEFSVGLLENPADHDWSETSRLSLRDRVTVAGSLFLWRKTLPSVASPFEDHRSRVTAPEIALPPGYVLHICRLVEELFPVGWDRGYLGELERAVPTTKSVLERGAGKGGYRSTGPDRLDYGLRACGERDPFPSSNACDVKYMDAQCDGKSRAVTVMSSDAQVLKPLHKLLYNQISKYPWLLRGKATPNRLRSFRRKPGEVFVSGDYESATDHLPVSSAEWILKAIFRRCKYVPLEIQIAAIRFLRVGVMYPDGEKPVATRQLMGSLLCFPLLCLQNYCAFRWCFGPDVPVRINGDDIVFRSAREDYERWASFVGSVGLRLSRGKTLVHSSTFSLNSTFFYASESTVRLIPVVRCSSLMRFKSPYPSSLAGSFRGFLEGFRGELRDELGAWYLRQKNRLVRKCGRSVVRGLGIPASAGMLVKSGLWRRELWYFNSVPARYRAGFSSCCEGEPLPEPPDRLSGQVKIPRGWRRVELSPDPRERAIQRSGEKLFWEEVVDLAWGSEYKPKSVCKDYWDAVEVGSYELRYHEWTRRSLKMDLVPGSSQAKYRSIVEKLSGVRGFRSRLRSAPLWKFFSHSTKQRKTVWVYVGVDEEVMDRDLVSDFTWRVKEKLRFEDLIKEGTLWQSCSMPPESVRSRFLRQVLASLEADGVEWEPSPRPHV